MKFGLVEFEINEVLSLLVFIFQILTIMPLSIKNVGTIRASWIADISSSLLILLFVYTGTSKLADHVDFLVQLGNMSLINHLALLLSYVIPFLEIITAFILFLPPLRKLGFQVSFVLLILFTTYLIYMIIFQTNLPCSCGGVIAKLSWKQHIIFNLLFILLSIVGIKYQQKINPMPESI